MIRPSYYASHTTARTLFEMGKEKDSWLYLFLAYADHAESKSYRSADSPRQKEVQRLWQQRGLLERTKANLRIVMVDCTTDGPMLRTFKNAYAEIGYLINKNTKDFNTIKERIQNGTQDRTL